MDVSVEVVDAVGCSDADLLSEALGARLVGPLGVRVEVAEDGPGRVARFTVNRGAATLHEGSMRFATGECKGVEEMLADKVAAGLEPLCPSCVVGAPPPDGPLQRLDLPVGGSLGVGDTWEPRATLGARALWGTGACCLVTELVLEAGGPVDVPGTGTWAEQANLTLGVGWGSPAPAEGDVGIAAGVDAGLGLGWGSALPLAQANAAPVTQLWVMGQVQPRHLPLLGLRARANVTRLDRYGRGPEGEGHVAEPWARLELLVIPAVGGGRE